EEVVQMIEKNKNYDLILMDIQMPKMNGHIAFKHLRNHGVNIPVIAQTAYTMDSDINEIKNLGYNDYIIKPIDIKKLFEKITKYLD
ncbi:MAG: hypothetical protein PWP52_279, partial [Bacteroidales bacterium]|nr:hypothetical protein [Bacteroidales bacterium]